MFATAKKIGVSTKISSSDLLIFSVGDEFLQVWLPSVGLTGVLSLRCRLCNQTEGGVCELAAFGLCFTYMLELPNILFPCLYSLGFSQFGMQNGTTEKDVPGLGSIHHQFTLVIKAISTKQVQRDWKTQKQQLI